MEKFIKITGEAGQNPTFINPETIVKVHHDNGDGSVSIDFVNGNGLALPPGPGADEFLAKFTGGAIIPTAHPIINERHPLQVFIVHPNDSSLFTVAEWRERAERDGFDPTIAEEVAIRFPDGHIAAIEKRNLPERTQEDHIKYLADEGAGRRLGRRDEWIYVYDARFIPEGGNLDEALELIGGDPITRVYWTEERDADVQSNSGGAWVFGGNTGDVGYGSGRVNAYYGRGFRAFDIEDF